MPFFNPGQNTGSPIVACRGPHIYMLNILSITHPYRYEIFVYSVLECSEKH